MQVTKPTGQQRMALRGLSQRPRRPALLHVRRHMPRSPLPQEYLQKRRFPWTTPSSQSWTASFRLMCVLILIPPSATPPF